MSTEKIITPSDAKEFDVRRQLSRKKDFNCVGPRPPLPCYCGGKPGPRPPGGSGRRGIDKG